VSYAELHCLTNFSFLRGASHPEELVERAHELGYAALAITDECSMAGVVRAHVAAREHGLRLIVGSEFRLDDGPRLVLLATNRRGYGQLCRLITRARRAAEKGSYRLVRADLASTHLAATTLPAGSAPRDVSAETPAATSGIDLSDCLALWLPGNLPDPDELRWLAGIFPERLWIAVELLTTGQDRRRLAELEALARELCLPLVAAGDVHMHARGRRRLQDALTATRLRTTVECAGFALYSNGERHLRPLPRLNELYPRELIEATLEIAARCRFSLDELRYEYPHEIVPDGETPSSWLRHLTLQGMQNRWPGGAPGQVIRLVEHELALIAELNFDAYFLTVHDIVSYARSRGILCQGRGSAANSAVCFCLGITEVDPGRMAMLFERFISRERNEPPDIDVDFEHERREEVIQYVYAKYGRARAALAATVICYRPRSALRDMAKALGLDPLQVEALARSMQWWDGHDIDAERVREAGLDPESPVLARLIALARSLLGFPRHLSQHVGGFVISRGPLEELVPIENAAMADRTVIQWDKDDLDAVGLLKVDVLGLGMLTAIRRSFDLIERHRGTRWTLATVPAEDPRVYEMACHGDTMGVFQIESRAQMAMLPRLKPECYYDLVIEVAIVRPGPIQGDMVHPYLRRRNEEEPVSYPSPEVEGVLKRTLGVPIFQEQVMQLAVVAAGFTPGEADRLRRAMAAWKRKGGLGPFEERLTRGMRERGYSEEFARQIFRQILGFGEYGFPECVVGETRVVDADTGRWPTIDEIVSGRTRLENTLACDDQLRLRKRKVLAVVPSGMKPVWRLRTALGHTITATAEHPFMTMGGWRQLGKLRVDDYVAAVRSIPVPGRRRWPRHQILVLADLIAEGNLCHPSTFYFYTTASWHRDEFVRAVEQFPNTRAVVERHRNCFSVRVVRRERDQPAGAVTWARSLGIWGCSAREKHLPPEVFELCDGHIALLLARLWEGDGGFSMKGHASYDTASRRLGSEVQHLLLRLGIIARLYRRERSYKGRKLEHYVVTVTGEEPLRRFWRHIGRRFLDPAKRRRSRALAARGSGRMSRSDIYWDRIVVIEALGSQPTYDLQIEGDHNFVADNLVVHNSHAASFALLVYVSAWLKRHEPAAFAAALINSQPMGFYAPSQLVQDARRHGVEVRPVDVDASDWDCTLEPTENGQLALRLGLRLVKGFPEAAAIRLAETRRAAAFDSVQSLAVSARLDRQDLGRLAAAGALVRLTGHRHRAAWQVAGVETPSPLFTELQITEGLPLLRAPREGQDIVADYRHVGLSLRRHPLALLRQRLDSCSVLSAVRLREQPNGSRVRTAGLVITRQRPGTASGVTFVTLEDETGYVNLIVWRQTAERQRRALVGARLLGVTGELQLEGEVMHVIVHRLTDLSRWLGDLVAPSRDFR
jgi:DNA-directed DNA polymerase III PolC